MIPAASHGNWVPVSAATVCKLQGALQTKARECSIRHQEMGCSSASSKLRYIAISIFLGFFYYEGLRADMPKERVGGGSPR